MNKVDNNKLSILIKESGLYARNFLDIGGLPHPNTLLRFLNGKNSIRGPHSVFHYQELERFLEEALRHKLFPIAASVSKKQNNRRTMVSKAFTHWKEHGSLKGFIFNVNHSSSHKTE